MVLTAFCFVQLLANLSVSRSGIFHAYQNCTTRVAEKYITKLFLLPGSARCGKKLLAVMYFAVL